MSEQSVKKRLAEAGWRDRDSNGCVITSFGRSNKGFIGTVAYGADERYREWLPDGERVCGRPGDLVPLSDSEEDTEAPEAPGRLTDVQLQRRLIVTPENLELVSFGDVVAMARECIDSRREIVSFKAEVDRLTKDAQIAERDRKDASGQADKFAAIIEQQSERIDELTRERDVAIEIGRCLRDKLESIDTKTKWAVVSAFDERYHKSLPIGGSDPVACDDPPKSAGWRDAIACAPPVEGGCDVPETHFGKSKCSHEVGSEGVCQKCLRTFGEYFTVNSQHREPVLWQIGGRQFTEEGKHYVQLTGPFVAVCDLVPFAPKPIHPRDIGPIDITGGMSSEDFVWEARGEMGKNEA